MALRFIKCLVVVTLVHVFAAVVVVGAYHFARAGNQVTAENGTPTCNQRTIMLLSNQSAAAPRSTQRR